jgi:RNA polymerase sigma-70 factor, ECF subfamily
VTDGRAHSKRITGAERVIHGPAPDFQALYRSQFPYVWKTLRRLGAPARDLEDLVHDLFLVVHRQMGSFDPARPIKPWLFGIAVRVVADFRRSPRSTREALQASAVAPQPVADAPGPDDALAGAEARALLLRALDTLDLDRRAVFVMHELDEVPVPAIAAVLSVPLNTAYSRLRLARADVAAAARRLRGKESARG